MQKVICAFVLLAALTSSAAQGDSRRVVMLSLEQTTTVHVGDYAVAAIPPDHIYDRARRGKPPFTGGAIVPARLSGHRGEYVYRAVHTGAATIVIGPDVPNGECISCRTLHYFVEVEP